MLCGTLCTAHWCCGCFCTAVGERDTRPEDAEEVTYNPQADFTLRVPSAHKRLRELRELREAAATAEAAASKQQQTRQQLPQSSRVKLFSRGYHSHRIAEAAEEEAVDKMQQALNRCSIAGGSHNSSLMAMPQRLPLGSGAGSRISSISRLLGCRTYSSQTCQSGWCGIAAAPLLA